jgi:DNA helicase-2/ATP-dependent DNA helicase PcrA
MPLTKLNPEQLSAATAPLGQNLIIASAGTGKTSTIIGRIAHLLKNDTPPEAILLLTFTNKAAGEMIDRIAQAFGQKVAEAIQAGTFHSISYKWLKRLDEPLTLKQPSELKTLFKTVYDHHLQRATRHDNAPLTAAALYDYYSLWENRVHDSFSEWLTERNAAHEIYGDLYEKMFEAFGTLKQELGFVGFNDLLLFMRARLLEGEKSPFQEVLVDEYQDTNPLQNALLEAINPPSLFCVGDYDQSIYAFNGAEIGIIGTFDERYPSAQVFSLSKNYRSSAPILSLAGRVIAHNPRIYPKELEVTKTGPAAAPALLAYGELFDQYQDIARRIAITPTPKNEIAVIFRNNSSADGIEAMLRELSIPCRRKGGGSFFDAREIKVLLDLITLAVNSRDLLAFVHILEYGPGIGGATAKEIYDAALIIGGGNLLRGFLDPKAPKAPLFAKSYDPTRPGLFGHEEVAPTAARTDRFAISGGFQNHPLLAHPGLQPEGAQFLAQFYQVAGLLCQPLSPARLIEKLTAAPLYEQIADKLAHKRGLNKNRTLDENLKAQAKERIFTKAQTLKELSRHYGECDRFINAMVLGAGEMSEGSGVNLLSVHASKGLEFDEVFVIDLMDGRFPNRKLMSQGGEIEEERRLFYVAATRAREKLFLSYANWDKYKKIDHKPSQFLYEAGLIEGVFGDQEKPN